ncbi:MAG: hypothetical protein KDD46_00290 [Bdellovibrionales bacterium]|nr:hypothetical protein [Bdellovibrionales bacterium]
MKKILLGTLVWMMACSTSPLFEVDIVIAANQNTNPMLDISSAFEAGQSRGVYFLLDPLSSSPNGINDTTGTTIESPSLSGLGMDPLQDSFTIDPSLLSQGVKYRLRMVAFDINGNQTHIGTSDCPIFVDLQSQPITLCFGTAGGGNPLCGGTTSFGCCEGITSVTCNE